MGWCAELDKLSSVMYIPQWFLTAFLTTKHMQHTHNKDVYMYTMYSRTCHLRIMQVLTSRDVQHLAPVLLIQQQMLFGSRVFYSTNRLHSIRATVITMAKRACTDSLNLA